ncbi:MAG: PAS domain S-box protein [Desulfobacterales bacterium]|nr:PAS domain S-box protein [Desulfobacterales bacterium]
MTRLQMVKGWAFVLATGLLIYVHDAPRDGPSARGRRGPAGRRRPELPAGGRKQPRRHPVHPARRPAGSWRPTGPRPWPTGAAARSCSPSGSGPARVRHRRPRRRSRWPGRTAEGILFETVHRRKDGTAFPVEISSRGATIRGVRTLISIGRDITERRRSEDALRASESRFRTLRQLHAPAGVDGHAGRPRMDMLQPPHRGIQRGVVKQADGSWEWSAMVHPEDLPAHPSTPGGTPFATGRAHEAEHRLRRRDGSCRWF